jgi:hypothetical protein
MKLIPKDKRNGVSAIRLTVSLAIAAVLPLLLYGSTPAWWSERGVLTQNATADDYAPVNQGQLKNIASAAVAEMDAKLPGGAGTILHELIASWSTPATPANDFAPINVGQLKNVTKPFYDRLIAAGLASQYPWSGASNQPNDFAVANIGQVKNLFGFELPAIDPLYDGDHNGLPDQWERQYFAHTGIDPNADLDGDGISNLQEYRNHSDPTDFFNGTLSKLAVRGGGDQRGNPGTLLPVPISVAVSATYSGVVWNAPVTVTIEQGAARLVPDGSGASAPSDRLTLRTNVYDNEGYPVAQFYVLLPPNPDVSVIRASTQGGTRSISVVTTAVAIDTSLATPTDLRVTATSPSSAKLTWAAAANTLPTTIQASIDDGKTWITVGTVRAGLSEATVTRLTPGHTTKFRIFSGGTPTGNNPPSFTLPDSSNGSPPRVPPGSNGGGASDSADVVPLALPVVEVDQAEYDYGHNGGYLGISGKLYKNKEIVVRTHFLKSDESEEYVGSTTNTFAWVPGNESYGRGDREVTSTVVTGEYGGLLFVPSRTVISTDTLLLLESTDLSPPGSTASKTVTLSNPFTDADAEAAGAAAVLRFYGEFYELRGNDFAAYFGHGHGNYDITIAKYRFRVNADPDLIVLWDVQFTPFSGGPIQHDIHSWHGDGSPYSPVFSLDPRLLNAGQNGSYKIVVISAELMVDANRDGEMSFDDVSVHDADQTSEDKPYRFWVNDDDDGAAGDPDEHVPPRAPDYADGTIQSIRDLEDFARLQVNLSGLEEAIESGVIRPAFEWKQISGNPRIKLYRATSPGTSYLTDESAANSALLYPFRDTLGEVAPGTRLFMPAGFWVTKSGFANIPKTLPESWLLFEGSGEGKGELALTFWHGNTKIGEAPGVWLDLKDIRKMYERAIATPESLTPPYESNSSAFDDASVSYRPDVSPKFEAPADEEETCLIFVHGWKPTEATAANAGQTMFKRLWWEGFKGRFATFRWPTLTSNFSYNTSEWLAWKYGRSLNDYVTKYIKQQLPEYRVTVAAHSMGNVVTGSALKRGMTLNKYMLMEAALPAGCYDDSVNNYPRFLQAETSNPTPDTASEMGYRLFLQSTKLNVGSFVSFFNVDDYALATGSVGVIPEWPIEVNWEKNEVSFKPDTLGGGTYRYQSSGVSYFDLPSDGTTRQIVDVDESLSFVARPRSRAVGTETHNASVFGSVLNLQATCNFGAGVNDHSGQFTRPIQQLKPFYARMMDEVTQ